MNVCSAKTGIFAFLCKIVCLWTETLSPMIGNGEADAKFTGEVFLRPGVHLSDTF